MTVNCIYWIGGFQIFSVFGVLFHVLWFTLDPHYITQEVLTTRRVLMRGNSYLFIRKEVHNNMIRNTKRTKRQTLNNIHDHYCLLSCNKQLSKLPTHGDFHLASGWWRLWLARWWQCCPSHCSGRYHKNTRNVVCRTWITWNCSCHGHISQDHSQIGIFISVPNSDRLFSQRTDSHLNEIREETFR